MEKAGARIEDGDVCGNALVVAGLTVAADCSYRCLTLEEPLFEKK